MRIATLSSLVLVLGLVACSNNDGAASSGTGTSSGGSSATLGGSSGTKGNSSGTESAGTGGTGDGSTGSGTASTGTMMGPLGGSFAHGINTGYLPPFTDTQTSQLAQMAGSDSVRVKLPEDFFNTWGYPILTDTMKARAMLNMGNYSSWLCTPTAAHSTAPANGDLDYYIPTNLYEPIFNTDGTVNPMNYWADYVSQTITTYSPWIKLYSVWNEPDWVSDYSVSQGWATKAPTAADLPRFNGSIYDYARMLRITKEVATKIDPTVKIAVGGLGYSNFLLALTKYTDNPAAGAVSSDYPSAGIHYVDVLDLHYYPVYTPGNSDAAVNGLIAHRDSFAKVLSDAGLPSLPVVYTESGAPHVLVAPNPGGPEYARNYLMKAMVEGQAKGLSGIQWFDLSDGSDTSSDPYQSMGLYSNLTSATTIAAATKTDTGVASTTLGTLTKGLLYDAASSAAVNAPAGTVVVVYGGPKKLLVAWATASDAGEDGSAMLTLPFAATEMMWDFSTTQATTTHLSGESVALGSDPRFFSEQ